MRTTHDFSVYNYLYPLQSHNGGMTGSSVAGDLMTSYNDPARSASVLSESMASTVQMEDGQGRRMSDPVRPLDRNFGVGGQLSRHRSFSNLQGGAARQPLHQQRVNGMDQNGGFMPPQVRHYTVSITKCIDFIFFFVFSGNVQQRTATANVCCWS